MTANEVRTVDSSEPLLRDVDLATLETRRPALLHKWEAWAEALTDQDLERVIDYRLLHVVNHATLHRGQAMGMLRQMGVEPPHTDLIYYYRDLAAAA